MSLHRHRTSPVARPPRPGAASPARAVGAALAVVLTLAGCGLRLETPAPTEPTPDAVEQVRRRTVDDALALAGSAAALAAQAQEGSVLQGVLADVETFSTAHAQELGGVYDSGLPRPTASATPTPTAQLAGDVGELLGDLVQDAATAAGDADTVTDAPLARLVAAVGVSRDVLADRLAAASGTTLPEAGQPGGIAPAPQEDASPTSGPAATDSPAAGQEATAPGESAGTPPAGAGDLALAHDEAAWTLTVLAARSDEAGRPALLASAAAHRSASDTWARLAGVLGQPTDPRRSSYALPAAIDDPTVAGALPRTVEQAVAEASARVVAGAAPGARGDAIVSLRVATRAAAAWGAAPVPFPGMPELGTTVG